MSYIQKGGICVVAGEASGDIQASLLIEALNAESAKKFNPFSLLGIRWTTYAQPWR